MAGYTKLFASLLASTIWRENDKVRIVWITLLAMANQRGIAEGSIPGIADLARVSVEDCEKALARLQEPDRYSRSPDHDGRRVRAVDGGFLVLNHAKYRERLSQEDRREYQRRWQADRRRVDTKVDMSTDVDSCRQMLTLSTQAEAEAEASKTPPTPLKRGARITRKLRERAKEVLRIRFGQCRHEPPCPNHDACVEATALELAERKAS